MRCRLFVALLFLPLVMTAHAETPTQQMARCAATDADAARLVCYDALAKQLGVASPKVATAAHGAWRTSIERSPIDDSTNVYVMVDAADPIQGRYKAVVPTLAIRCQQNKTEAYVDWSVYLGLDSTKVLERLDRDKARTRGWLISTNRESAFAPDAVAFSQSLMKHDKLLLQVTPYGENPVMATFPLAGLPNAIAPLRKACHW